MSTARTTSLLAVLAIGLSGWLTPAEARQLRPSIIVKLSIEPSIGGTAIGAATGTVNGAPISIPEASWTDTHSQKSPLLEAGVAFPTGRTLDILALLNYGHAGANSDQVGTIGGNPLTLSLDDYTFWGIEGGIRLRKESGAGPYATVTAGFRRVSEIQARLSAITISRTDTVYDASAVPAIAFGGGMLWGDRGFAMGLEVAVRYAGAPSVPSNQTLTPASGAGARWSLPIGIVFKF